MSTETASPPASCRETAALTMFYGGLLIVVAGILTAAIFRVEPLLSANDRSRWCTIWSLVERGTYQIDEIDANPAWSTIDKVRHDGHFYSSKPPLLSTLYAGVYWAVKKATGWNLLDQTREITRAMLLITQLAPWLVAIAVWCRLLESCIESIPARVLLAFTAAFGTLVTTFTVSINNHSLGAVSAMLAVAASLRLLSSSSDRQSELSPQNIGLAAAAGFFAAFTVTCELPAALFGLLLFLLLLWKTWRLTLFVFVPAALVPLTAYFATNAVATGGWKPFYSFYGTEKYRYVHEGIPSYWVTPKGMDRAVDSPAVYLLHCTVGHHGILSLTPVWLVSLIGWAGMRSSSSRWKPWLAMGLVLNVVVLGFYLSRPENYNYGGNTAGLRWMIWLTPFWLIALIPPLERYAKSKGFCAAYLTLLVVSVFSAHYSLDNPWKQPWLFSLMERWGGLKQYAPDPPKPFARPLTTWFAEIPKAIPGGDPAWIELEGVDSQGRSIVWRLTAMPSEGAESTVTLHWWEKIDGRPAADRRFTVDRAKFEAGRDPQAFLVGSEVEGEPDLTAAATLRGLPAPRAYREGVERALRTSLRRDAFWCQRAASRVLITPKGGPGEVWCRTDLWLTSELPFGVARLETTVTDAGNGETLSVLRMSVRDCSPRPSAMSPLVP